MAWARPGVVLAAAFALQGCIPPVQDGAVVSRRPASQYHTRAAEYDHVRVLSEVEGSTLVLRLEREKMCARWTQEQQTVRDSFAETNRSVGPAVALASGVSLIGAGLLMAAFANHPDVNPETGRKDRCDLFCEVVVGYGVVATGAGLAALAIQYNVNASTATSERRVVRKEREAEPCGREAVAGAPLEFRCPGAKRALASTDADGFARVELAGLAAPAACDLYLGGRIVKSVELPSAENEESTRVAPDGSPEAN